MVNAATIPLQPLHRDLAVGLSKRNNSSEMERIDYALVVASIEPHVFGPETRQSFLETLMSSSDTNSRVLLDSLFRFRLALATAVVTAPVAASNLDVAGPKLTDWKRLSPVLAFSIVLDAIKHPLSDTTFDVSTGKSLRRIPSDSAVADAIRSLFRIKKKPSHG